jgi:vancomycin permeability regulator SanA
LKSKIYILSVVILSSAVSVFLLAFTRYSNQNLLLSKYSFFKTGNLISGGLFFVIIVLALINIFMKPKYNLKSLVVISIISFFGLFFSALINFTIERETKIYFGAISLALHGYVLISLFNLAVSRSKKIHYFSNAMYLLIVALIGFVGNVMQIYYFKDDFANLKSMNVKADAGVILGAAVWGGKRPSPVFRERINKGFELYENKIVQKLVLTGGGSPGELSEAEVAKNELIKYGVNSNNLLIENQSISTNEQIQYIRDNLYFRYKWNKIIIISDNFHLFRSSEICRFSGINVNCVSTDTPRSAEGVLNFCIKESVAVLFFWFFGIG